MSNSSKPLALIGAGLLVVVLAVGAIRVLGQGAAANSPRAAMSPTSTLPPPGVRRAIEAGIDPGTSLHGNPAPDFTLTDQFGRQVSLHEFQNKVVVLAFTDSQCTTICPLTSQTLLLALGMLPQNTRQNVQLLGINANPDANSVGDVKSYSIAHGLEDKWLFLTGSKAQLSRVWKAYNVYVQVVDGNIDHTPALFVVGTHATEQDVFLTSGQYGVVTNEAHELATTIAALLPNHVHVSQQWPIVHALTSTQKVQLSPVGTGNTQGKVTLGPGQATLTFFFSSWAPGIQQKLTELNTYAHATGMPRLVAVDIGTTEPSPTSLQAMLRGIKQPLAYPLVVDQQGDVADAYQVADVPWFTLSDATGKILGSHDGWLAPKDLESVVRQTLQKSGNP